MGTQVVAAGRRTFAKGTTPRDHAAGTSGLLSENSMGLEVVHPCRVDRRALRSLSSRSGEIPRTRANTTPPLREIPRVPLRTADTAGRRIPVTSEMNVLEA